MTGFLGVRSNGEKGDVEASDNDALELGFLLEVERTFIIPSKMAPIPSPPHRSMDPATDVAVDRRVPSSVDVPRVGHGSWIRATPMNGNIYWVLAVLSLSCGSEDGPVTARVGAAAFTGRAGASYFARTKFFGFIADQERSGTRIEVRIEGLDPEEIGTFATGPTQPHEIRLELGDQMQSTRSMGLGSVEITEFNLHINRDIGVGEGRVKGTFAAQLDGLSLSDGTFDIPVTSADLCNQDVDARALFDCP